MLKISGNKISLTRGDSAYITISVNDVDGNPYELGDGDQIRCQVRTAPNTGELVATGEILYQEDGTIVWYLRPSDTSGLDVKKYYWDAQLELSNGDIFTFIPSSIFKLTDEVTMDA